MPRELPQELKSAPYAVEKPIMAHDFIPRRDIDFAHWSARFSAQINANPDSFGLTAATAADYAALNDAWQSALAIALAPTTRTSPAIRAKDTARHNAQREARRLARIIQATSGVTNGQRVSLGLTVHDVELTPVPQPEQRPRVSAKLLYGSTLRITVIDPGTARRGKPEGVAGATILTYVGDTPPANVRGWMQTNTTRPRVDVTIQDVVPGAKVWIAARWFNPRQQAGPVSNPVTTHVQCQTLMQGNGSLRLAA